MDFGAAMPMRTLEPLTSITSTTTSSPIMTFSPGRRVMMSIARAYRRGSGGLDVLVGQAGEERRADRCVRRLVDDLVADGARDQDRGGEVRAEVLEGLGGADGHVDRGRLGVL